MYWSSSQWETLPLELNKYRLNGIQSKRPLIIKTESSERLSLMCNYVCDLRNCSNSFLVPPIRMLGTQYTTIVPPCSDSKTCKRECITSNIFNYTYLNYLEFNSAKNSNSGESLLQQPIRDPKADSYIGASYDIAVVCASIIGEDNNEPNFLVHFLPAADTGGYVYKIVKTKDFEREILHFVATDGNTVVHFSGNNTNVSTSLYFILQHAGDSTEIDITSDNKDPVSFLSNKPIHVIAHVKQNNVAGQTAEIPFNSDGYNFVHVPPLFSLNHADGRSITEVLADDTYIHTSNSGWPHLTNLTSRRRPIINRNQIPGDGIDNDKDGLIDEEYCGFLIEDIPTDESTMHDVDLDGSYNEDCKGCKGGYELRPYLLCMMCGFGTYRENHSHIDKCQTCPDNFTTFANGSFSLDQCVPACGEGMHLDNDTMECVPCPVGYYKNVQASDTSLAVIDRFWCKHCPDNKTTVDVGTVAPEKCIEHCVEGKALTSSGTCEACDIGFYKNISSADNLAPIEKRWNCSECDNNKTTFYKGTVQAAECISNCVEGMFWNGNQCLACPVGFYKNASSESPHIPYYFRWNCTTCPAGTTTFSTGSTHCIDHCKTGYHLDNGTCIPCDIGFYKNTSSEDESLEETLRWNCRQCPQGQTTNSSGAEFCIQHCPVGEEFNVTTRRCVPCALGFYKPLSGSHVGCDQCPVNHTTRHVGAVNRHDCKLADCKCPCNRVHVIKNYTSEELATVIDDMKKELTVKKESLSASIRKKISVMDNRPSAKSLGSFGIAIFVFVFALLIAFDFFTLKEHMLMFFRNLKNIF